MILTQLTLIDFGSYPGKQTIALSAKKGRNVVLFGGKNGAGKSTLLEAIRLCFYGQAAYPEMGSRQRYEAHLLSKIHSNPTALIQPTFASVAVTFQFGESDGLHTFTLTRSWERTVSERLVETFDVERDGKQLEEVSADHWQEFVRDLLPPGVSQLFFFDGEKIQQLAEDSSDQRTLSEAVKSLLGVDIIERLHADLSIYRSKLGGPDTAKKGDEKTLAVLDQLSPLDQSISELLVRKGSLADLSNELRSKISSLEQKILSEGGSFARNREKLVQQESGFRSQIEQFEGTIRDLASGLLPFTLCPALTARLKTQILLEEASFRREAVTRVLLDMKHALLKKLSSKRIWKSEGDGLLRKQVLNIVEETMGTIATPDANVPIHHLSPEMNRQLEIWIDGSSVEAAQIVTSVAKKLEDLYRALQRTQIELGRVPPEGVIRPLLERLNSLHQEFGKLNSEIAQNAELLGEQERKRDELRRLYAKLISDQDEYNLEKEKATKAVRIQAVLEDYKIKLIEKRVAELQRHLTECYQLLSRKKDVIRRIEIDPNSFAVTLRDRRDKPVPKARLSAGEKQIYAISVLWALAKTSGRPLPMIIDTPLARLDADHRLSLAKHYFPMASHQTLVLSTDTEIDQTYFAELRPYISRSYRLDFVPEEGGTFVRNGYFWESLNETQQN
jgi:DNA sulfur modification protein DndD